MRAVVVTGVSTGIGWGTAKVLLERGFRVFGSVRKAADAERLSAEWGAAFTPLVFDITDEGAVRQGAARVAEHLGGSTLFGLVNNAGIAVPAPLIYQPIDEFRRQIEVNLVGQLIVTQAFVALLGADHARTGKPGRIVNISSVGGKIAGPFIGAYHASKFALEGLSESLRRELLIHGVDVIVVGPGAVATPIWSKAEQFDTTPFEHTEYAGAIKKYMPHMVNGGRSGLTPEQLGRVIHHALTTQRPRVRYSAVQRPLVNWYLPRLLPRRIADALIGRNLQLQRGT